jgi:hypothetical protein
MAETALDPWSQALDLFPLTGTRPARLRAVVRYAILAPSSHNSQPWRFRLVGERLEVLSDGSRALAVSDPDDRELTMACGAAVLNLRLALRHFGQSFECVTLPDPARPELIATFQLTGEENATDDDHQMFDAILSRLTNRQPFEPREIPAALLARAQAAAEKEGCWLQTLTGESDRTALGDMIAAADLRQMADRRFRRELAAWVHANRSGSHDGMPGYAHGLGDLVSTVAPVMVRTFDIGSGRAARDRDLALGSPALAVLWTEEETPRDWLRAGQALQRALLRLTIDGLSASFLNQPIELGDLRQSVARLLGREGYPQIILRLGYAPPGRHTPRRSVSDVLDEVAG